MRISSWLERGGPRALEEVGRRDAPRCHRHSPPRGRRRAQGQPPAARRRDPRGRSNRRSCRGCGSGSDRSSGAPWRRAVPPAATVASCSATAWRVIAPDREVAVLAARCPRSSSTRFRSTMCGKRVSRMRQQRHEALPTGEDLGVVAVLGEQRRDVGHRLGSVVFERSGLHRQLRQPADGWERRT